MSQDIGLGTRPAPDTLLQDRISRSLEAVRKSGRLTGSRTKRISARLDPGLVAAAMERNGIDSETDLVEAALALIAEPDEYAAWLISQRGALDEDFALESLFDEDTSS